MKKMGGEGAEERGGEERGEERRELDTYQVGSLRSF